MRRATSHSSTALNRSVANSRCSSSPRLPLSARRNCANSPCGSSTTWKNWSALMPSSGSSSAAASSMRVETVDHCPAHSSSRRMRACSVVVPVPRALGRSCAGLRVNAPAPSAEGHLELDLGADRRVGVVGPQAPRAAADTRHPAVQREADAVEQGGLARPRLAVEQEQPVGSERVEVDLDLAGEGPEGAQPDAVGPHADAPASRPASSACASSARSSSSAAPASDVEPPQRTWRTNSVTTARSSRPATRAP